MSEALEVSVEEAAELLRSENPPRLLDVREGLEWQIVHLDHAELLTQELLDELLENEARDRPIVCYCHHGIRSLNAAHFLREQGFTNVRSMRGGIDAWACEIDPTMNRY